MDTLYFTELNEKESIDINGGSVMVVCSWLVLGCIASPAIYYVGEHLVNEFKRGYADGKAGK